MIVIINVAGNNALIFEGRLNAVPEKYHTEPGLFMRILVFILCGSIT